MSREAVDRMTKQIIKSNNGRVSPDKAKQIAVKAAIKYERDSARKGKK